MYRQRHRLVLFSSVLLAVSTPHEYGMGLASLISFIIINNFCKTLN